MPRAAPPGPSAAPALPLARPAWIALGVALVTLLVFAPVRAFGYVGFDDPDYVLENPAVRAGLSPQGLGWALTSGHASNWHPLTWLSHMLDVELFGLEPGPAHLVNALLHALSAGLLVLVLARATHSPGKAGAAALLFALHPLRVESVAWIAERKDVLALALGLASTLAWLRWTSARSRRGWVLAHLLLALGLAAKPMLVTLPCAWLLLDAWPLGRLSRLGARAWTEKLAAFALVAASCVATVVAQSAGGALEQAARVPLGTRAANAAVAAARYLAQTAWPRELSVFYPHPALPGGTPLGPVPTLGAGALLVALSALALAQRRARPWLLVGWLWFLGTLVPVIGLVQVGAQSHADRYTYLPSIGLALALTWQGAELLGRLPLGAGARRLVAGLLVAALALGEALATRAQLERWRDSRTLLEHALSVAPRAPVLWNNLGVELRRAGRADEAEQAYRKALEIDPRSTRALYNLALSRQRAGALDEAEALYRRALADAPRHLPSRGNLAGLLRARGEPAQAARLLEEALAAGDDAPGVRGNLANALVDLGRAAEAERHYRAGLAQDPNALPLRLGYGALLLAQNRSAEAAAQYQAALALAPQSPDALEGLRRARAAR